MELLRRVAPCLPVHGSIMSSTAGYTSHLRHMALTANCFPHTQDWGAVELLRRVAPCLPVHGSTQMSITSAEGAAWAAGLGVERVVVGRELSVREIAKVRAGAS